MQTIHTLGVISILGILAVSATSGCENNEAPTPTASSEKAPASAATTAAAVADGKIPITTSSPEAKAEFLKGRDQSEKLLATDCVPNFQNAIKLDPNFALAELNLANTAPNGKEFFDHLKKAVSLADKASKGEKLMILAAEAGANGNVTKQKEYLDELVKAYPSDERAHFAIGNVYFFGLQDYAKATEHFKKATELNASYSPAYNLLGYAYRQTVDYPSAEKAFQKYIELIPKDPNPYDSYGELLLKMGRFDDSVAQYQKALAIDANFTNAYQGIAMDLMLSGKADEAAAELDKMSQKARTDAERRNAMFALTVLHVDGGKIPAALEDLDKQYALGEKTNDAGAMSFDAGLKGTLFLEQGKPDQAKAEFERALKVVDESTLSQDIKDNTRLAHHYNLARLALAKKDAAGAKAEAEEYRKGAEASKNPNQGKLAHELAGMVALDQKDYEKAIAELKQANQQNPQNIYRMCQAYQGKGDADKAKESCAAAANFNVLPNFNYALIRAKAKAGAGADKKG